MEDLNSQMMDVESGQTQDFTSIRWMGEQILLTEGVVQTAFNNIRTLEEKIESEDDPKKIASRHLQLMNAFFNIQHDPRLNIDAQIVAYAEFHQTLHNILRYWVVLTRVASAKNTAPWELEEKWKEFKQLLVELGSVGDSMKNEQLFTELKAFEIFSDISIGYLVGQSQLESGNQVNTLAISYYVYEQSQKLLQQIDQIEFELLPNFTSDLQDLDTKCLRQMILAKTGTVIQAEDDQQKLASTLSGMTLKKPKTPCLKNRKYEYDIGDPNQAYNLVDFPLPLQSLLPKPTFLDLAHMQIQFPYDAIQDKAEQAGQEKGFLSNVFGW